MEDFLIETPSFLSRAWSSLSRLGRLASDPRDLSTSAFPALGLQSVSATPRFHRGAGTQTQLVATLYGRSHFPKGFSFEKRSQDVA